MGLGENPHRNETSAQVEATAIKIMSVQPTMGETPSLPHSQWRAGTSEEAPGLGRRRMTG